MGNTRNTGYLQNIVLYDANDNITLPARLAVTGTVSVNNTTPYDTTQFSLDINGGLIVKNINKTAQFVLINSNPASGGNNAFVVHTVGGTSASSYADIQGYYGTSIAGSTVLRLNPQGGNVLVGSLAGTGSRMVVASSTGVLSTQAIVTLGDLSGVSTSRTITINGTTQDLSANRTWTLYTDDISEDGSPVNLWFTNARARAAISVTGSGSYDSATGIITVTGGVTAVNTKTGDVTLTTSDITEGTRLYYTDTRVGTYLTSNSYATQSYVTTQIANLVDSAPGTLDTLNELAAALGDDPNFATSVATSIGTKQAQLNGTGFVKISGTTISYDNSTYLTSFTETDPIYVASSWYSTTNNASNWNTAYGWGNHASAGYLTTSSAASTYASLTGSYANPSWITSLAYSKLTGVPSTFTPSSHTHAISEVTGLQTALDGKEPSITAGTTAQYWRGDKTWQTLPVYTLSGLGGVPTSRTITINGVAYDLTADRSWSIAAGVTSFNTRTGAITLSSSDVTTALGYTPYNSTNPSGYITSSGNISGYAMSLNGYANQTLYTILDGPANGPVIKVRYDSATANRYIDIGSKDGNGVYSEGLKIYNGGSLTMNGNAVWTAGNFNYGTGVTANYVVQRDANGYIYGNYFNSNTSETENPSIGSFFVSNGDGWHRKASIAHVRSQLGNYGSWITSSATITGGADRIQTGNTQWTWTTGAHTATNPNTITLWDQYSDYGGGGYPWTYGTIVDIHGRSAHEHDQLFFNSDGQMFHRNCFYGTNSWNGWRTIWDSSNLTNLSQLSNGPGYITSSGSISGNAATATSATQVVTIQDSAPGGASGKLWWESDTGKLKVYYGSAWVDASPIPDSSLFFAKAGGVITGDVSIGQTLNVVGNTLVQGTIYSFGDIIAYSSSDARLKDNITIIESPLEKLFKINGVSFNWNDKQSVYEVGAKDYGVIAQEVEAVLPELVTTRDNGYKAVRYEKIVSLLIEAIKEQQTQINNLTDKLNKL